MDRISDLEKRYVMEALSNEFETSKNSIFNNKLESSFALGIAMALRLFMLLLWRAALGLVTRSSFPH